jgi:hypothetical protein
LPRPRPRRSFAAVVPLSPPPAMARSDDEYGTSPFRFFVMYSTRRSLVRLPLRMRNIRPQHSLYTNVSKSHITRADAISDYFGSDRKRDPVDHSINECPNNGVCRTQPYISADWLLVNFVGQSCPRTRRYSPNELPYEFVGDAFNSRSRGERKLGCARILSLARRVGHDAFLC